MRAFWATTFVRAASACGAEAICTLPSTTDAERKVALTFDDGPCETSTSALLDVLDRFSVPATFFLIGENAERHPELVRKIVTAGHDIGNHSYTHINCWSSQRRAMFREFHRCTKLLQELTDQQIHWLRPPYGKWRPCLQQWARKHQQQIVHWNIMPNDFGPAASVQQITNTLSKEIRSRSIICLHDNEVSAAVTPAALEQWLPAMLEQDWQFVTLDAALRDQSVTKQ